jgi:hypothetical protein
VNLDLDGVTLRYATAQPILKIRLDGETYVFFKTISGIAAEFAFPAGSRSTIHAERGMVSEHDGLLTVRDAEPGLGAAITVHGKGGLTRIVLLSDEQAKELWRVGFEGRDQLVLANSQVYSTGSHMILRQIGKPFFDVAFFPACRLTTGDTTAKASAEKQTGVFQFMNFRQPERKVALQVVQTRVMGKAPAPVFGPKLPWRHDAVVMAPDDSSFSQAGEWKIAVPQGALDGLNDLYLGVHYQGDEARLLSGSHLLVDNFFNGTEWQIGLKRFLSGPSSPTFSLQILPLNRQAPIFFEPGMQPRFDKDGQAGTLDSVEALPEYEVDLSRR